LTGLRLRYLGCLDFTACWAAMRRFTASRDAATPDEIWLLEHPPVYTLGLNGDPRHLLEPSAIPLIRTDRGGQITWHGPGQLVAYALIDLRRRNLGIKRLVHGLEQAVIALLGRYGLPAEARPDAPGVYVGAAKIASVGLRVSRGCSYHGVSLNVNPDLTSFDRIDPCGYPGLTVTSLARLGVTAKAVELAPALSLAIMETLGYPSDALMPEVTTALPSPDSGDQ
jgi:lipoyl(octanoyl) transferase